MLLCAHRGPYPVTSPIRIGAGGAAGKPVSIAGVDGAGRPARAKIVGNRTKPGDANGADGAEALRLLAGADHLSFSSLAFENVGNGAIRVGADIADLEIRDVGARNVGRFLEDNASEGAATASIDGLTIRDVDIAGFSKGAIRLQDDTRRVTIDNVSGDSERQPGGTLRRRHPSRRLRARRRLPPRDDEEQRRPRPRRTSTGTATASRPKRTPAASPLKTPRPRATRTPAMT